MSNKQLFFIAIFVLFIFLVLIALFILRFTAPTEQGRAPTPTPRESLATRDRITISGIQMKNFNKDAKQKTPQGDVQFSKSTQYNFVYEPSFNVFLITILASPFEEVRKKAEEDFLKQLGITQKQACELTVYVSSPSYVNPEIDGKKFPLSFCEKK